MVLNSIPMTQRFDATRIRRTILDMAYAGSTVHIPCAFSIVEILAVLYRSYLRFDCYDPRAPDRDYLVLSKGHGVMAQYACLHELGWLSDDEMQTYFGDGTRLEGLSDAHVPGLEVTVGSLGHGLVGRRRTWRWRRSAAARRSACSRSSATARPTKARSGRRCCSPLTPG